MNAVMMKTVRDLTTTPEMLAAEFGISVKEAEELLRLAKDPRVPDDALFTV